MDEHDENVEHEEFQLPTAEEIHVFAEAVNKGRQAFGLAPVSEWQISDCEPGSSFGCLSAKHLIGPIEHRKDDSAHTPGTMSVGGDTFYTKDEEVATRLGDALTTTSGTSWVKIPPSIANVTDRFDAIGELAEPLASKVQCRLLGEFLDAGLEAC